MAITNQTKNSATPSNQAFGSAGITWDEAEFSWDEASGTWDNPYTLVNQTKNSGSITNEQQS